MLSYRVKEGVDRGEGRGFKLRFSVLEKRISCTQCRQEPPRFEVSRRDVLTGPTVGNVDGVKTDNIGERTRVLRVRADRGKTGDVRGTVLRSSDPRPGPGETPRSPRRRRRGRSWTRARRASFGPGTESMYRWTPSGPTGHLSRSVTSLRTWRGTSVWSGSEFCLNSNKTFSTF